MPGWLRHWRRLDWAQRMRWLACAFGIALIHAGLAALGHVRLQHWIEVLTHRRTRMAGPEDLKAARELAALAASAGQRLLGQAACLRRALLMHGWLRLRGLRPVLHLGMAAERPFRAHAWVELEGVLLLDSDAGFRAFRCSAQYPDRRRRARRRRSKSRAGRF